MSHTIDEALEKIKPGKFHIYLMIICGAILNCSFIETTSVNLILPIAECELELSNFDKGLLGGVSYVGIILSSHLWGFLADTAGRKKILIFTLLMAFIFSFLSGFSKSFEMMLVMRFFVGFFISATQIAYAFVGEFTATKNRSQTLMITSVFYGLFCYFLPLTGYFIINQEWKIFIPYINLIFKPWRFYITMNAIPTLLCAILLAIFIPESPKFLLSQGNEEETKNVLMEIYKINTGGYLELKSITMEDEIISSSKDLNFFKFMIKQAKPLLQMRHLKNLLTASFLQFGFCLTANGFWTFLPEMLVKVYDHMEGDSQSSLTICEVFDKFNNPQMTQECMEKLEPGFFVNLLIILTVYLIGWLIISIIINRVGKLACLLAVSVPSGICAIFVMFVKSPIIGIYLYSMMLMAGMNIATFNTSTVELFPTSMRALAVSISMMAGRIGSITGSNLVGLMINNYCQYTWLVPAILLLSGSALMFTIPNIRK